MAVTWCWLTLWRQWFSRLAVPAAALVTGAAGKTRTGPAIWDSPQWLQAFLRSRSLFHPLWVCFCTVCSGAGFCPDQQQSETKSELQKTRCECFLWPLFLLVVVRLGKSSYFRFQETQKTIYFMIDWSRFLWQKYFTFASSLYNERICCYRQFTTRAGVFLSEVSQRKCNT